jgi:Tfp pilus assembly protein PilF
MRLRNILGIAVLLLISLVNAYSETRLALVIGNDSYPGNSLANARNDAKAIGEALASVGYKTTTDLDLNRKGMIDAVQAFNDLIQPGDTVVFYYAGHGLQVNGENYLVPIDFSVSTTGDVKSQGYSLSQMRDQFVRHGAVTQVIILDACRNNPFLGARSIEGGWAGFGTSAGTLLAFGTSPGSTAADDPSEPHGLFTQMLLKHLGSALDIEQMLQLVRLDVIRASHGQQVPWVSTCLVGAFHVNPQLDASKGSNILPLAADLPKKPQDIGRSIPGATQIAPDSPAATDPSGSSPSAVPPAQSDKAKVILIQQAILLAQEGEFDEAVRSIRSVLAADPRCALALRVLGLIFHLMGRSATANETLTRALEINPEDSIALYYRCLVTAPSDPESAIRDCDASIELDPTNANSHAVLASALLSCGMLKRANEESKRAIDLGPDSDIPAAVRGKVLMASGRLAQAQQEFQRAVSIKAAQGVE